MNQADIVKIKEHFEPLMGDKTLIIMRDEASVFTGKSSELEKYKIYTLDRSIGPNNIKNMSSSRRSSPRSTRALAAPRRKHSSRSTTASRKCTRTTT
jgi:hypothetical protein